jgi:N-methylhydantoinase B
VAGGETALLTSFDPIQIEVIKHALICVPEEMGAVLERTSFSPNIKERRDYSCAIFDAQARLLAQAAHIPVHLGAMPLMMRALYRRFDWRPGDIVATNDPAAGGTHLPDITLLAPVFADDDELIGFVASRAHHSDVGGLSPGSMPMATESFQEGIVIPPVRLVCEGTVSEEIMDLICRNTRTPHERRGDLSAQMAASATGVNRFKELARKNGVGEFRGMSEQLLAYSEAVVRAAIDDIPDGKYRFHDLLDDDGFGSGAIAIQVLVDVAGDEIGFDFGGSDPQVKGMLNAPLAVTTSACYYVVFCLSPPDTPINEGCLVPVRVVAPEGTIVNATRPAAIAGGNVETSQRIVDTILGALSDAVPDRIPAASQGTMNNVSIGGFDPYRGREFAYYETLGGGAGASRQTRGCSGIHTHMSNTQNTPIEALEFVCPLRVTEYSLREGSGGRGRNPGGDGLVREVELLARAHLTVLSDRRERGPWGANGGEAGVAGENSIIEGEEQRKMPGKFSVEAPSGARLRIETPGGGGWGRR